MTARNTPRTGLKAVLLDIDGTLLDSNDAHARAWVGALQRHGHQVAFETVRPYIGKGGDKLLAELLDIDDESETGKAINQTRRDIFTQDELPALQPTRGARDLLERLVVAGLRLVVATSASGSELQALLRQAGVEDLIQSSATSSDASSSKPDPDIVQAALGQAKLPAEAVVMLGDTPYDIEAAGKAGVDTVALRCGGWWKDDSLADAVAIFDDPADLLEHWDGSLFDTPPATPRIACLGWGSLVWRAEPLAVTSPWVRGGPSLPIEFARVGDNGELATVIWDDADPVPTRWAMVDAPTLEAARELLRRREEIDPAQPELVAHVPSDASTEHAETIGEWARAKGLDAVVWTALPPRHADENGRAPTQAEALAYLRSLEGEVREHAEYYVRHVPEEIGTPYREAFARELGWETAKD